MSLKLHDGPTAQFEANASGSRGQAAEGAAIVGNRDDATGRSGSPPVCDGPTLAETLDYVLVLAAQLKKLAQAAGFGRLGLILMMAEQEAMQQLQRSGGHQSGQPSPDGTNSPSGRQG